MSIASNKIKGSICGLCHDYYTAQMTREHNNANILAMGARVIGEEVGMQMAQVFLETKFKSDHANHPRRIAMFEELENEMNSEE